MENTDLSVEEIVKLAVAAGRTAAERAPADAYKATERRLYALPILREKLERDRKRLPELNGIARANLEAGIAADADEVKTLDHALADCAGDAYYKMVTGRYFEGADDEQVAKLLDCETVTVWRHRRRLVERIAVWLYGAAAVARGKRE